MSNGAVNPTNQPRPHSADQFGPQRDFWWHHDFLELMAVRWRLAEAGSLADIGCGRCHWSRLLYPYLRQPARFAGVDHEARWVSEGAGLFRKQFPNVPSELISFHQADAISIPLPDNEFDVVTCQTVLMHLRRPLDGLREMRRILRPGGLLICVEPNNLWNYLPFNSMTPQEPTESIVRRFEFWLRYHRGKQALGEGDHTIGDLLPGYFAELGLGDITVCQSDRCATLYPPYEEAAQQAMLEQQRKDRSESRGPWDREALRKAILEGGGTAEFFEGVFRELCEKDALEEKALAAGKFHSGGAGMLYLVGGRKP